MLSLLSELWRRIPGALGVPLGEPREGTSAARRGRVSVGAVSARAFVRLCAWLRVVQSRGGPCTCTKGMHLGKVAHACMGRCERVHSCDGGREDPGPGECFVCIWCETGQTVQAERDRRTETESRRERETEGKRNRPREREEGGRRERERGREGENADSARIRAS